MSLPGDQMPPDVGSLMRRIDALERKYNELAAARSAESTTIRGGTTEVQDASGNIIVRMGQIPSVFGPTTVSGFDLIRPGGKKVFHYESPGFWALHDSEGRVIVSDDLDAGKGMARPWLPVPMYPMFQQLIPAGTTGYATMNVGTLAAWEGRASISHPYISVDGIWGPTSGSPTGLAYALRIDGVAVGTWGAPTLSAQVRGPFSVANAVGRDWSKVEVAITASGGSGTVAIQPLGVYLHQSV